MDNHRPRRGWDLELPTPANLDYWLVRAGILRVVRDACECWRKELPTGARLLDVGCGSQPYRGLVESVGLEYTGIDWPQSIHPSDASDIVLWDLGKIPWPIADSTFDAILCTEVLEHVRDPARLLAECARVSRPGALMLLTAPLAWPEHEHPNDYFRFTRYGLQHLLEAAPFSIERILARGGWNTALAQMLGFWACHALRAPWKHLMRILAWPAVALLAWLDTRGGDPEFLLTLGFAVFARCRRDGTSDRRLANVPSSVPPG